MDIIKSIQQAFMRKPEVRVRNPLPFWSGLIGNPADFVRGWLSGSNKNFASKAGRIYDNATVFPAIAWYWRNMQSARIIVQTRTKTPSGNLKWEEDLDHPLVLALNTMGSETVLWFGTLLSWFVYGNVYWYRLVNSMGDTIGYRYLPNNQITPKNDKYNPGDLKAVSYYEFRTVKGQIYEIRPEFIVHLRYGVDPVAEHLGISPLYSALREVVGDNTAATIGVALLENAGIAGIALVPKQGVVEELSEAERLDFVTRWKDNSTGDSSGNPNLLPFPVDVVHLGYKPNEMVLDKHRKEAVSRILASFGIDPMVLGFHSEQKTYSNFGEALEAAWETGLLPTMTIIAKQLTSSALWHFEEPSATRRVWWDTSEVRALSEDLEKLWSRARQAWRDGMIKRSEAKSIVGMEFDESDEVYIHDVEAEAAQRNREQQDEYADTRRKKTKAEDGEFTDDREKESSKSS